MENTYTFSNHNNNKFILLLQKGPCPYEYIDDWEKLSETLLLEKELHLIRKILLMQITCM